MAASRLRTLMAKEPFMPLFFGDFLASTAEWEGEERALYLLLLGYQWSLGSLPTEPRRICKLVGWDWQLFERCWSNVGAKFQANAGRLLNQRLEQHRVKSHEISEKRAASGSIGGKAAQANARRAREQMLEDGKANAKNLLDPLSHPIPSQSEEEVSSKSERSSGGVGGDASRKRAAERGSRIPTPFLVTAEMRRWAAEKASHVDLESATEDFCNYWRALPGQRSRKLDWVLTWKNRMRECEDKAARRTGNGQSKETIDETLARLRKDADEAGEPAL